MVHEKPLYQVRILFIPDYWAFHLKPIRIDHSLAGLIRNASIPVETIVLVHPYKGNEVIHS